MSEEPVERAAELPESWAVHLPVFDGPLDLLLHLVRINRVEITDIPVAVICDQFHAYLGLMEELNLDIAADYVYEAAILIHLKSKLLLPRTARAGEAPEEDPRQDLVRRLLEYQRIKGAAQSLAERYRLRQGIWTRPQQALPANDDAAELEIEEISLYDLLGALQRVLHRYDREHPPPLEVAGEVWSVRRELDRLLERLEAGRPFDLIADLRRRGSRGEVIAAFLAVLELARMSLVRLHQTEGGDLLLYRTTREARSDELEGIQG